MSAVASIVADMTRGLDAGGSLLVLSDYDGTLTPIVSDPTEARLPPGVHKILRAPPRAGMSGA